MYRSKANISQLIHFALKTAAKGDASNVPAIAHHALLIGCNGCLPDTLLVRSERASFLCFALTLVYKIPIGYLSFLLQDICALVGNLEAKCPAGASRKQLNEASGAVLIEIEMTVKLMTQGKV